VIGSLKLRGLVGGSAAGSRYLLAEFVVGRLQFYVSGDWLKL
jgi:hypothetical protein